MTLHLQHADDGKVLRLGVRRVDQSGRVQWADRWDRLGRPIWSDLPSEAEYTLQRAIDGWFAVYKQHGERVRQQHQAAGHASAQSRNAENRERDDRIRCRADELRQQRTPAHEIASKLAKPFALTPARIRQILKGS